MIKLKKDNKKTSAAQKKALLQENKLKLLNPSSPFAVKEAYVQLRTNMMFSVAATSSDNSRVFAVTSSNPREGKSISASNIAISFAMLDKNTLLIDCDMRKPNVHRLWGLDSDHGMSNLLTNIDECKIHKVKNLSLSIITAGKIPPNPSELIASPKFAEAIAKFRTLYDVVIIDTPPVNEVADSQILSQYIDGLVFVARSGSTQTYELKMALENLEQSASKVCGILVNGVDPKSEKYSYKSGYYSRNYKRGYYSRKYGYGKGYGYGRSYGYGYSRGYGSYGNYGNYGNYGKEETSEESESENKES